MVGMVLEIDGDIILDRAFYCIDGFAGGDAGAIADAKDMRVHRLRRIVPPHIQHNIRRLAAHAGQ